jgi:predicted AAA+ superfamily ATPase
VLDSLIETTIARDVLLMTRVDKPVLLRRVFELGCRYSGQVLSYTKMLGQLQDAGKFRGRLVESSVGAHFTNAASDGICELFCWRERNREVDFVVQTGLILVAIEVKSGRAPNTLPGLDAFVEAFKPTRTLLVGGDGV